MAWSLSGNIRGASGPVGATGASGVPGSDATVTTANITAALGYTPESTSSKGVANGYASLDGGGKIPVTQLPSSIMEYQGTYDASSNSPSLTNGTGSTGDVYRVSVAGSRNFGAGSISFEVGDYVIYNGSVWEKSDTTDAVASVAGLTGNVATASLKTALLGTAPYGSPIWVPNAIGTWSYIPDDMAPSIVTQNSGSYPSNTYSKSIFLLLQNGVGSNGNFYLQQSGWGANQRTIYVKNSSGGTLKVFAYDAGWDQGDGYIDGIDGDYGNNPFVLLNNSSALFIYDNNSQNSWYSYSLKEGGGQVADLSIVAFGANTTRAAGTGDFPFGVKLQRAVTFSSVTYRAATADASGNLVVGLRKNGVAVSGSSATIAAASQIAGGTVTGSWDFAEGDIITVQITGVGTTPGKGLVADVKGLTA